MWNYRILAIEEDGEVYFKIAEVYYRNEEPYNYKETSPFGCTVDDLLNDLEMMKLAFGKPIIYGGDKFPELYKP